VGIDADNFVALHSWSFVSIRGYMKAQFPDEETKSGEFKRQEDAFREWVSNNGSTPYGAEACRYHLYVSLACPWASRTLIVRKLKGLADAIGMTVVDPVRDDLGWAFRDPSGKIPPGAPFESTDPINGFHFLSEAYKATDPDYHERVTVPVLWDKQTKRIVNNCEDDICRMFNDVFNDFSRNKDVDLFPKEIQAEHAKLSDFIYDNVNNGVYKAGFARRQRPYEVACRRVFQALDQLEHVCRKADIYSGTALWRRTGDYFARSCVLTRFTTAISSATCDASSIIQTCRASLWTCTNSPASPRRSTWITSSGITT
jgi:putative glutathione S-transferase